VIHGDLLKMTRVLITGIAGFIGSHVARHCVDLGFDVVGVDELSGGLVDNVPAGVEFRKGSITDNDFVSSLWDESTFDYIYHLAAYAAEGLSHFIRRFNYTDNLIGSVNLINQAALHQTRCFVFVDRSLRRSQASHQRRRDPAASRSIRHRKVRSRIGPGRCTTAIWVAVHNFSSA